MLLSRRIAIALVVSFGLVGCGDADVAEPAGADFDVEETFDFDEAANSATSPDANNLAENSETPPPACPTRTLVETSPDSPAAIDSTHRGAVAAFVVDDVVRIADWYDGGWEPRTLSTSVRAEGAVSATVAGVTDEANDFFWVGLSREEGTELWGCEETCSIVAEFDFVGPAQVYSNTPIAAYVGGLDLNRAIPRYEIRFYTNGRTGLATFAEAPSVPAQYGFTPIAIPTNPGLRTEFRAAWDTGMGPLSYVSVNTSVSMELEPECNQLDLLGGRVVPLSSERGILVSSSGEAGPVLTYDACDGDSPPVFLEISRGLTDFDVATAETSLDVSDVYWIDQESVWGVTIDATDGSQIGPSRRVATVPNAQFVRAAHTDAGNAIVVTTDDGVVGVIDDPSCVENTM